MNNIDIKYYINKTADDYVGILVTEKSETIVNLPIGYKYVKSETNSLEFQNSMRKLFKLLALKNGNKYEETQIKNEFDLISSVRVLENYIEYGFYKKNSIETKLNSNGRVDWKKTICSNKNYNINGKKIYNNIYTKKFDYNKENQVKNIQKFCLNEISRIIGSFFGISFYENIEEIYTESQMIEILKSELRNTNQDKKIEILENLIKFIENTNFKKITEGNIIFKYQKFQYIWQQLVDCEGITKKEKKLLQPKAEYRFWENNEKTDKIIQPSQPDTIMIDDKNKYVFIFDAKYYKEDNLPNEYDIFKQIRYGEYVRNELKIKFNKNYKIINAFILPKSLEENFEIMNYYATSIKDREADYDYEKIYVIYVDTKSLIDNPKKVISEIKMKFIGG